MAAPIKKYYFNLDLVGNTISNFRIHPLTTTQRTTLEGTLSTAHYGLTVYDLQEESLYTWNGSTWVLSKSSFLKLTDTPDSYSGNAGKILAVSPDETGVEFLATVPGGQTIDVWNQEDANNGKYNTSTIVSHNGKLWRSLIDNNTIEPSAGETSAWEAQSVEDYSQSILTEDIISTVTEGNINAGETLPIGMTFTGFVKKFFQKIFYPTFIEPSLSIVNNIGTREIGSTVNQSILANYVRGFINGNMSGGVWNPDDLQGFLTGNALSYKAEWNGGSVQAASNVLTINKIVESGANNITVTVDYGQGDQPVDSTGADYESPRPGGTITKTTSFTGGYYNFYGVGTLATNSASVRALFGKTFTKTFSLIFAPGQTKASFAYPATISDIINSSVKYVEGFNSDVGDTFTKSLFDVNDAGGNPVPYKIYTVEFPAAEAAQVTYNVTLP